MCVVFRIKAKLKTKSHLGQTSASGEKYRRAYLQYTYCEQVFYAYDHAHIFINLGRSVSVSIPSLILVLLQLMLLLLEFMLLLYLSYLD